MSDTLAITMKFKGEDQNVMVRSPFISLFNSLLLVQLSLYLSPSAAKTMH